MIQNGEQQRFLKYLWFLLIQKKLIESHLLGLESGFGPRRPDPIIKVRIWPNSQFMRKEVGADAEIFDKLPVPV
jgi:hypothetical protein